MRFVVALLFSLSLTVAKAAGFDCSSVSSNIELMICSDEKLSLLDANFLVIYKKSRDLDIALLEKQKAWIKQVRNKYQDMTCLKNSYKKRIAELNATRGSEEKCKASAFQGMWQKRNGQASEKIYNVVAS